MHKGVGVSEKELGSRGSGERIHVVTGEKRTHSGKKAAVETDGRGRASWRI